MSLENANPIGVLLVIAGLCAVSTAVYITIHNLKEANQRLQRDLDVWHKNFKFRTGNAQGFGDYNLFSMDGGKTWYARKFHEDGTISIAGPAEVIFPGLLEHLQGMDALINYVKENGPIDLASPTSEGISALTGAGFTVTKKDD